MSSNQSTTTTTSPVCAECRGMKNLKDAGVFSLAVKNPRIQCVCASKEDLQKFICKMYWIGENGGDTAEEVVAFIKKHKLLDLEEDEEDEEDEEKEPYCYENSTKDTIENDTCFCSVGGCHLPTFE